MSYDMPRCKVGYVFNLQCWSCYNWFRFRFIPRKCLYWRGKLLLGICHHLNNVCSFIICLRLRNLKSWKKIWNNIGSFVYDWKTYSIYSTICSSVLPNKIITRTGTNQFKFGVLPKVLVGWRILFFQTLNMYLINSNWPTNC